MEEVRLTQKEERAAEKQSSTLASINALGHAQELVSINASGHAQELDRNFSLVSLIAVGIVSGNAWTAGGGTIVRHPSPIPQTITT